MGAVEGVVTICACGSSGAAACRAGGLPAWGRGAAAGERGRQALMLTTLWIAALNCPIAWQTKIAMGAS